MSARTCVCGEVLFDLTMPVNTRKGTRVWFCPLCRVTIITPAAPVADDAYMRPVDMEAYFAALEGECGCDVECLKPVCHLWGGCDVAQAGMQCECPRSPGRPCPHQKGADHKLAFDRWIWLLWKWLPYAREDGEDYALRPRPQAACQVHTREARVALMALRESLGVDLRHVYDQVEDSTMGERRFAGLRRLVDRLAGEEES